MFAVKGARFITHMKTLSDVRVPLANFLASGVFALEPKLGPLLWQLPPTLAFDPARLAAFLELLPRTTGAAAALAAEHDGRLSGADRTWPMIDEDRPLRPALEVKHPSFGAAGSVLVALLTEHDIALVVADTAGRWPFLDHVTSDVAYARLHGDVYLYFDNDAKVRALFDAMALAERLGAGPQ